MPKSTTKWPAYAVGPEAHIHALGVIAINYNGLEIALDRLLNVYLGATPEAHSYIFQCLNLHSQVALFEICVAREKDRELRLHLLDFCVYFNTCANNRNLLMHSNLHEADTTDDLIGLAKRSKKQPHIYNDMQLTITELRAVADEIHTVFLYAAQLFKFITFRKRRDPLLTEANQPFPLPALPERPVALTKLATKFQPNPQKQ